MDARANRRWMAFWRLFPVVINLIVIPAVLLGGGLLALANGKLGAAAVLAVLFVVQLLRGIRVWGRRPPS